MRFGWLLGGLFLVSSSSFAIGCAPNAEEAPAAEDDGDIYSEDDDRPLPDEPDTFESTAGIRTLANGKGNGIEMTPTFASPARPNTNPSSDTRIQDHLADLINGTPDGETIQISAFLFADAEGKKLAEDLVRAHENRHVKVRVVHDGKNQEDDDAADKKDHDLSGKDISDYMRKHIGDDYVMCKQGVGDSGACIAKKSAGRMHAKFALFSKTKGSENVVWISSNNLNSYSGTRMFNNSLTVRGDAKLYKGLQGYFSDLIHQKTVDGDDYYDPNGTGRGYTEGTGGTVKVHASPTAKGDILLGRLDNITPGEGCHIRLAESDLSAQRLALVDRLEELGAQGCSVQMVVSPANFGKAAQDYLADGKHSHIQLRQLKTHDKVITIYAKWNGSKAKKKVVLAGSHNFADSANRTNDELLSVVEDNKVYNRYTKHVLLQWKHDQAEAFDTSAKKTAKAATAPTAPAKKPCEGAADGYYCSEEFGQPRGQILSCIGGEVVGYAPCPSTCASLHDEVGTATCE